MFQFTIQILFHDLTHHQQLLINTTTPYHLTSPHLKPPPHHPTSQHLRPLHYHTKWSHHHYQSSLYHYHISQHLHSSVTPILSSTPQELTPSYTESLLNPHCDVISQWSWKLRNLDSPQWMFCIYSVVSCCSQLVAWGASLLHCRAFDLSLHRLYCWLPQQSVLSDLNIHEDWRLSKWFLRMNIEVHFAHSPWPIQFPNPVHWSITQMWAASYPFHWHNSIRKGNLYSSSAFFCFIRYSILPLLAFTCCTRYSFIPIGDSLPGLVLLYSILGSITPPPLLVHFHSNGCYSIPAKAPLWGLSLLSMIPWSLPLIFSIPPLD